MKDIRFLARDEQYEDLLKLAVKHRCKKANGEGDIPAFFRLIADGHIAVGGKSTPAAAPQEKKPERKKFRFYAASPPKFWPISNGVMDLDELTRRTGTTRAELEEAGFRCTPTMVRAPIGWTAWSDIQVPDWWVDNDNMPGMLLADCPVGADEIAALGLRVMGDEVILPSPQK